MAGFPHSDISGSKSVCRLPEAFRRLPRLSSPLTAKASTEVIQPQVPLRLPCYDFTPVMNHTVVTVLPKVRLATSGATHSHGVTGGVYKARELELQTAIRTTIGFLGLAPPRGLATLCTDHCSTCVAQASAHHYVLLTTAMQHLSQCSRRHQSISGKFIGCQGLDYQDALRPIIPDNTRIPCITAAAGTELADAYSS
eukprot:gene33860-41769_t